MRDRSPPPNAGADPFAFDAAVEHVPTPLWREGAWPLDWVRLRLSPVYCGRDLPHGSGEPVLVVPGFLAGDGLMLEMLGWLRRIGYRAYASGILWNTQCPERSATALARRAQHIHSTTGERVRVVGHSLGGMLAKSLVQRVPDAVDRVVTLGSPFRDLVRAHPAVVGLWDELKAAKGPLVGRDLRASCGTGHCLCSFVRHLTQPDALEVAQFAIYSKRDGVVEWQSCVEDEPDRNSEVHCTHLGMAFDPGVYRALAQRLAETV